MPCIKTSPYQRRVLLPTVSSRGSQAAVERHYATIQLTDDQRTSLTEEKQLSILW